MKSLVAFLCCIMLLGCSSSQLENDDITKPELLEQYPLPPIPPSVYGSHFVLNLNLHIMEDGSVKEVIIKDEGVDKEWILLAKESILKWKYSPALVKNKPVKVWINQRTIIEIAESLFYVLAEIQFDSLTTARQVYKLLIEGMVFGNLARTYSTSSSGKTSGLLGKVDVMRYPSDIRREILRLRYNEFTAPLKYGGKFIIFMRLKD